jgi:glyoxylase-like metal-dependent hydrolase (beta-lactamase superfamily II)
VLLGDGYQLLRSHGHTPGMVLTHIESVRGPVTFGADLVFALPWVHLPITAGYDRYPELVIDEKRALLERLCDEDGWVFLTHDAEYAATRVERADGGRFTPRDALRDLAWAA